MGCVESDRYSSAPSSDAKFNSILVTKKTLIKKNSVTFNMSNVSFKALEIFEELSDNPWYNDSIQLDDSDWEIYHINLTIGLKHKTIDDTIYINLMITLGAEFEVDFIISLLNWPKKRMEWDPEILKMSIVEGDKILDATVSILDRGKAEVREWKRSVRRFKDYFVITYELIESIEGICTVIVIDSGKNILRIYYKEILEDSQETLRKKFDWGNNLVEELFFHRP